MKKIKKTRGERSDRKTCKPAKKVRKADQFYKNFIEEYEETESNGKTKCTKRKYKNERAAKAILSTLKKKGREEIRYYVCRYCNKWHLTSKKSILIFEEENNVEH